ncbi:MAG: MFS transporter, partial [Candidatus Zixiibacteriota bacterium]
MTATPLPAHRYKLFTVAAIGTFMATLDGSIVNVALPTIADALHASVDLVAWVVLAYSLTLIALMLVFGSWVQHRGYYFGYRFGYTFFLLGSLACSLAPNIYALIAGRVLQATGTAMFAAIGPGMITTIFPAEERGKGLGLMVMMVSAGFMTGPPLGGFMLGIWPWSSIFLINLPVGVIGLWMVRRYFATFEQETREGKPRLLAASAMSLSLLAAVFAVKMINRWSLSDWRVWTLAAFSLVMLIVFLKLEANPDTAMIGLGIFKNRRFTIAISAQQAHFVSVAAVLILLPFYLERVQGLVPRQVGLYLVILPVLMLIIAPLAGRLSDRIGYRFLTSAGMATMGVGVYLFTHFGAHTSMSYVVFSLFVLGCGVGMFSTPNSSALMGSVTEAQRAVTSSILATNRNIGQSMGVALSTAVFSYFKLRAPSGDA